MKRYGVVEVFQTIQGEGYFAGRPAVFLRLAGCNLWSGLDSSRTADALRTGALCPRFCDTDFHMRHRLSAEGVLDALKEEAKPGCRFLVVTGGEPLLQLDDHLLTTLFSHFDTIAVETNGTFALSPDLMALSQKHLFLDRGLWVTCSPKLPAEQLKLQPLVVSELKVVFPKYSPLEYFAWLTNGGSRARLYIQPEAYTHRVGDSTINHQNMSSAAQWCIDHPEWRLSIQAHKILGLR